MSDPLNDHKKYSAQDLNMQYDLRARRPDYDVTVIPVWAADSATVRQALKGRLDLRYGAGDKQKLDVFYGGDHTAPSLIYFHGGYWQRGDKSIYSFLAKPFVDAGVNVVVVGYDLCPAVTITQISAQARAAIAHIWKNAHDLGLGRDHITIMGHSAGGHITQMMMGTDWAAYDPALPVDLIRNGVPISPLSYLEPVRLVDRLNDALRMDATEAHRESPITQHPPMTNAQQMIAVGGAETDEFKRQAQIYLDKYHTKDRPMSLYHVPDVDHFDLLNVLADPSSEFFKKTCAMLNQRRA